MRRLVAAVSVVAAMTAACSGERAGVGPTEAGVEFNLADSVAKVGPAADVPAAALKEPAAVRKTDQLIRQAGQNTPFCSLVELLDRIPEPDPGDLEAAVAHASRSYNLMFTLDPLSKVNDVTQLTGAARKVTLPDDIVSSAAAQRAAMYAYWVRLTVTADMVKRGLIKGEQIKARVDDAFVRLVTSEYTPATDRLEEFRLRACGSVSGLS